MAIYLKMLLSALVFTRNNRKAHSLEQIALIKGNIYTKRKNFNILGAPTYFKQIKKHHISLSLKELQKEHYLQEMI